MPSARVEAIVRRWAAPATFLLAVTIAVLLVRSGLERSPARVATSSRPAAVVKKVVPTTTTAARPRRYYVIKSGDTLGGVASSEHTTVEQLRALNPGVDPTVLRVGQRIRVG